MNDRLALLRNIITNPKCDTSRLVYADYIQEHDAEERSEFIRVQVELAKTHTHFDPPGGFTGFVSSKDRNPRYEELRRRERELWENTGRRDMALWFHCPEGRYTVYTPTEGDDYGCGNGDIEGLITRGFVSHITCTAEDFLKYVDQLIWNEKMTDPTPYRKGRALVPCPCPPTAQPVEKVTLTTEPVSTSVMSDVVLARFAGREPVECKWYRPCRERTVFLLNYYWPGIEFELPTVTSYPSGEGVYIPDFSHIV